MIFQFIAFERLIYVNTDFALSIGLIATTYGAYGHVAIVAAALGLCALASFVMVLLVNRFVFL